MLVDSAGCGAALKDYGHLLGTPEAGVSRRGCSTFRSGSPVASTPSRPWRRSTSASPCRTRATSATSSGSISACPAVLTPHVRDVVELDDDGLCCGAGGAYSALEPALAGDIRDRKVAAIAAVAPDVVASANPGCALHLAAAGVPTVHPMELVAAALAGRADALAGIRREERHRA